MLTLFVILARWRVSSLVLRFFWNWDYSLLHWLICYFSFHHYFPC